MSKAVAALNKLLDEREQRVIERVEKLMAERQAPVAMPAPEKPCGCKAGRVLPSRPLRIVVADQTEARETFEAPGPLTLSWVLAEVEDGAGLYACTLGWGPPGSAASLFWNPTEPTTDDYPPMAHLVVDRLDLLGETPSILAGYRMAAGEKLEFKLSNLRGTPPYEVKLTLFARFGG